MTDTSHTLLLSLHHLEVFLRVCIDFRSYAWQVIAPSEDRNRVMKVAQTMQGRLTELRESGVEPIFFPYTAEEKQALRNIFATLMQAYGREPPTAERNRLLGEYAALRVLLERPGGQTQELHSERRSG